MKTKTCNQVGNIPYTVFFFEEGLSLGKSIREDVRVYGRTFNQDD